MAASTRTTLRPMRITGRGSVGRGYDDLPGVPQPVPASGMASDWIGPTEGNGTGLAPADLHIAILAPDRKTADSLKGRVRIIRPPLWQGGRIFLHVIPEDQRKRLKGVDMTILLAMVDLGMIDSADAEIGPPDDLTVGYPSNES
jgi:hypothetical protein